LMVPYLALLGRREAELLAVVARQLLSLATRLACVPGEARFHVSNPQGTQPGQASPLRCVDGSGTAGGLQCARSCGQADAPSVDAYGSPIVMYVGSLKYPRLFMAVIVGSSFCGRAATGQDQAHMQAGSTSGEHPARALSASPVPPCGAARAARSCCTSCKSAARSENGSRGARDQRGGRQNAYLQVVELLRCRSVSGSMLRFGHRGYVLPRRSDRSDLQLAAAILLVLRRRPKLVALPPSATCTRGVQRSDRGPAACPAARSPRQWGRSGATGGPMC
jgi:hypothetical protein